jgi:predicted site-specific integrase-resolvase
MKAIYTTAEVARSIGVDKKTLLRWLYAGKLAEPKEIVTVGSIENRIWSAADLERARQYKEEHYRKRS